MPEGKGMITTKGNIKKYTKQFSTNSSHKLIHQSLFQSISKIFHVGSYLLLMSGLSFTFKQSLPILCNYPGEFLLFTDEYQQIILAFTLYINSIQHEFSCH